MSLIDIVFIAFEILTINIIIDRKTQENKDMILQR